MLTLEKYSIGVGNRFAHQARAHVTLILLEANEEIVGRSVTENLYARHLRPLFIH